MYFTRSANIKKNTGPKSEPSKKHLNTRSLLNTGLFPNTWLSLYGFQIPTDEFKTCIFLPLPNWTCIGNPLWIPMPIKMWTPFKYRTSFVWNFDPHCKPHQNPSISSRKEITNRCITDMGNVQAHFVNKKQGSGFNSQFNTINMSQILTWCLGASNLCIAWFPWFPGGGMLDLEKATSSFPSYLTNPTI